MTLRAALALLSSLVSWLVAGALLGGCAILPFGRETDSRAATEAAARPAAWTVDIDAPPDLRALLARHLDLVRFQTAPEAEGLTDAELDRLMAAAPAQARALLETEGYFNPSLEAAREETVGGQRRLKIEVVPGPRATIDTLAIEARGALGEAAASGDARAVEQLDALRADWPLTPGKPFTQDAWGSAKNAALARLRAEGYPAAGWGRTQAQVDATANTVRLEVVADSGPLFRLGEIRIEGLQRYDATSVNRLATFSAGEPYSERLLLDFQERLQKLGLFEGATVDIEPDPDSAAATPVRVRLKEQPLQQATVGVGYSANTGPRLTLEHVHRRVFGTRWTANNKFELGPDRKLWEGELKSHPLDGLYRNLIAGNAERLRSADELRSSWAVRLGRTQDTPRIERLYYAELTQARVEAGGVVDDSQALSGNYHWVWRDLDSVLLPTQGLSLSLQAAGGYARSSTDANGPFGRVYGRLTAYRPLGAAWYGTARIEAGDVIAQDRVGVPDTLLFRAGGDDSVRGYAYRTLGPTVDGVLASGRKLLTASVELARPIWADRPAFWWAAFVDAGNVANRWNRIHPVLGYGLGLRWRSPVGPLRLDLAYGQEVRRVRLHLSVGIAF